MFLFLDWYLGYRLFKAREGQANSFFARSWHSSLKIEKELTYCYNEDCAGSEIEGG